MRSIWIDSVWVMLFSGGLYGAWFGLKNLPRIKRWRCTGEGIFAKCIHIHLSCRLSSGEIEANKICLTAIYFLDEKTGRPRQDPGCVVRYLHVQSRAGERVRVFWDGQEQYRIE